MPLASVHSRKSVLGNFHTFKRTSKAHSKVSSLKYRELRFPRFFALPTPFCSPRGFFALFFAKANEVYARLTNDPKQKAEHEATSRVGWHSDALSIEALRRFFCGL